MKISDLFTSVGLLIARVALGLFMLLGHGWSKVTGFGQMVETFPDPLNIGSRLSLIGAIGAEAVCSIFLVIGLATRLAAVPLAFTMGVALLIVHSDDPWQKKELAAVYLVAFAALICTGGGAFSLDRILFGSRRAPSTDKEPENA